MAKKTWENKWTQEGVEKAKRDVREALIAFSSANKRADTIKYLKGEIATLQERTDVPSQQKLVATILNALAFHFKFEGFTPGEVKTLHDLAHAALLSSGIAPVKSVMAYLYGDLYRLRANILFKQGEMLNSAWDLQLSMEFSGGSGLAGLSFDVLSLGIRCNRLGQCRAALRYLEDVDASKLQEDGLELLKVNQLRALRMTQDFERAGALCDAIDEAYPTFANLLKLTAWERMCLGAIASRDALPIVKSVERYGSHCEAPFVLEAYLWVYAFQDKKAIDRLPVISAFKRRKGFALKPHEEILYRIVSGLDACNDAAIPLLKRLESVESILSEIKLLGRLDLELLSYITLCRWVYLNSYDHLGFLLINEYSGYCQKITGGLSSDIFSVAGDLIARSQAFVLEGGAVRAS